MGENIPTITVKAVARKARELAQELPNHTATCTYVHYEDGEQQPNCIVGKAMAELGIPLDELECRNGASFSILAGEGIRADVKWLDVTEAGSKLCVRWLDYLQRHQDGENTWGEALAYADRRIVMMEFGI